MHKKILFSAILFLMTLVLCIGMLFAADRIITAMYGKPSGEVTGSVWFRYLLNYPYTGTHMLSDYHFKGEMPWEKQNLYKNFDVRTGDHGFFVDVDLDNPPKKAPNEFRIILVGGSGAQGWGGRTNDEMFYSYLERKLNKEVSPKTGLKYRVYNLAMAGSISYQNYVSLNIWGHNLEPDAIISWSGGNDLFVPLNTNSNAFLHYYGYRSMGLSARDVGDDHWLVSWVNRNLPGLSFLTPLKSWLEAIGFDKTLDPNRQQYIAKHGYVEQMGTLNKDPLYEVALPNYIHALQSIKRDFLGIPMMVMFQTVDWREAYPFVEIEYGDFRARTRKALNGYMNNDWVFYDWHDYWNKHKRFNDVPLAVGLHMNSVDQEFIADRVVADTATSFWKKRQ